MPLFDTAGLRIPAPNEPALGRGLSVLVGPDAGATLDALLVKQSAITILAPPGQTAMVVPPEELAASVEAVSPMVGLFTSGTTGQPRLVFHELVALTQATNQNHRGRVWGLLYRPERMAGLQVLLQAVSSRASVVEPLRGATIEDIISEFERHGVDSLAATPSSMSQFLALPSHRGLDLKFISLGGEIVSQRILDKLGESFPEAEVRHIYATTETGSVFSVSDGKAGFPLSYLDRQHASGRYVRIAEGQLLVSWKADDGKKTAEIRTGDLVEFVDDRALFAGRTDDVANVGGNKISLHRVENSLAAMEGIEDCRAYAIPNPFLGEVIGVDIKLSGRKLSQKEVRNFLSTRIPKFGLPAVVRIVDQIELSESFKKKRAL